MLIFVMLFVSIFALDISDRNSREIHYYRLTAFDDHAPIVPPVRKLDNVSVLKCASDCFGNPLCWVFAQNYNSKNCKQYGFNDFDNTSLKIENGSRVFLKDCASNGFTLLYYICLRISDEDELRTFDEAEQECGKYNTALMRLDDMDKFLLVLDFLAANGTQYNYRSDANISGIKSFADYDGNFLVGLTDRESEGSWVWQNAKPAELGMFSPGQPNNYDGSPGYTEMDADCAVIDIRSGGLVDNSCQRPFRFICEIV